MTYYQDLDRCLSPFPNEPAHRAIGWLSSDHPFRTGISSDDLVERLKELASHDTTAHRYPDPLLYCLIGEFGVHSCDLCGNFRSTGYVFVPGKGVIYVAPKMIHHYMSKHSYCPPDAFIDAVNRAPPVSSSEYGDKMNEAVNDVLP